MNPDILPPMPKGSLAAALEEVYMMFDDVEGTVKYSAYRTPSPDGEVAWFINAIRKQCDTIENKVSE